MPSPDTKALAVGLVCLFGFNKATALHPVTACCCFLKAGLVRWLLLVV